MESRALSAWSKGPLLISPSWNPKPWERPVHEWPGPGLIAENSLGDPISPLPSPHCDRWNEKLGHGAVIPLSRSLNGAGDGSGKQGQDPVLALEAFLKRERIRSWIDFSNSPWNELSKMSESEQLRSGQSSNLALGKSRKGNRGQTPAMGQGQALLARCLRACSLDNVRHVYICNVFKGGGSEIKSLGDLLKKESPSSPPSQLLPAVFSL